MIRFQCPNCNTVLQIGKEYAGQPVLCSSCNTQLIVPQMPVPEPTLDKADRGVIICICGQCKSTFKVPAASAGRQVPCPKCGRAAQVPEQEQVITGSNTLKFSCPACKQSYCVLAKYAGKKFKCLVCKHPCIIPQPASPPQDLIMLEEDQDKSPPPPPEPQAQAGVELSFKLLAEEEPQPSPYRLEPKQNAPPEPPEAPAPRPAARPSKTREKSSGSPLKLVAGIIAGIIGFVAGFAIVYMLVKSNRPDVQPEQVQTTEQSPAEEQTPPAEQAPFVKPTPDAEQPPIAATTETHAPVPQNPNAIDFARSLVTRINRKTEDLSELIYEFPDDVSVTDPMIQSVIAALDIGPLKSIDSTVEAARTDLGASYYIVKTAVASNSEQKRDVRIGFFEIIETDETQLTVEQVRWIYGISVLDETGKILASVGRTNPDQLAAQMDALVDEYGIGLSEEEMSEEAEELAGIAKILGAVFCPLMIVLLIVSLITVIAQISIVINAGEPAWALFVPVYRQVILCRVAQKPEWMGWLCGIAEGILYFPEFLSFVHPAAFTIAPIVYIIFNFIFSLGIAKAHDRGVGFGMGLFFLPIIFYPILAFSGKAYTD
jgi:hypothetical protein